MSETERPKPDVAIVGSGIAGAMVAYELARAGFKVLVLEAGPRVTRDQIVKQFTTTYKLDLSAAYPNTALAPRPDLSERDNPYLINEGPDRLDCEYLRIVGGTTWHWAGATPRMLPSEFAMKSTYGVGENWPISYANIERYYLRAEREIGVCGDDNVDLGSPRSGSYPLPPMPLTYLDRVITARLHPHGFRFVARPSARNSVPYDNRLACHGFNSCSPICPTGAQYAAIVHVRKAEALGARVMEEALVTRLDVAESGAIRSLTYKRPDGTEHKLTAKAYVLAANGIETPRLMLASRSERTPNGLANSSDHVGRHLMDHPGLSVRFLMPEPVYAGRGPDYTVNFFGFRDGRFRRFRAGWGMSLYNRLHLHDITNELLLEGVVPPQLDRQIRYRATREVEFDTHVELLPNPENRIRLDEERRDSAGLPLVHIYYRIDEYTLRGFEHCRQILRQIARLLGATRYRDRGVFSHHHLMGTTRMGNDPKTSVVDRECRAHDHRNLFIAGSSVFPTGSTANPTLTIAALVLRLSNTLRERLARGEL